MSRKYRALILNDYENAQYAEWVKTGKKTIETRTGRRFSYLGDLVICCGKKNSPGSPNAGKALCIVELYEARAMNDNPEEIAAACIGWQADRYSHLLRNWRHFSRDFDFAPQATMKNFQGIFEIEIPEDVAIIPKPEIKPFIDPTLVFQKSFPLKPETKPTTYNPKDEQYCPECFQRVDPGQAECDNCGLKING